MGDSPVANIVASVSLIALGLIALFLVIPAQTIGVDPGELPGSLLPSAAAWIVVGASVLQLIQSLRSHRANVKSPESQSWSANLWFFAGSAIVLSVTLILIAWLGYVIGGSLGVLLVGVILRPQNASRWWLLLAAGLVPVSIYYLAWHLLRLSLP